MINISYCLNYDKQIQSSCSLLINKADSLAILTNMLLTGNDKFGAKYTISFIVFITSLSYI